MDETTGSARLFIKFLLLGTLTLILFIGSYGGFIFWQTQTIKDPNKCLTTKMFKVNLCPSNPNYVRFKQIPKHFFQALILSEDASFYSHKGFDWNEIKESFRRNFVEWKFARGGSTLTQQLAKNLYLSSEKSVSRKFKEFFIAKQIEEKLSKTQILEKYANVVEFGDGIFGIQSAAYHYFGKSASSLNSLESIFLVSLLPSPKRLGKSLVKRKLSQNNLWRMKIILQRMYRTKRISDELYIYIKMLMEDSDWPFDYFSIDMFDSTIEDQLFEEFNDIDEGAFFEDADSVNQEDLGKEAENPGDFEKFPEADEPLAHDDPFLNENPAKEPAEKSEDLNLEPTKEGLGETLDSEKNLDPDQLNRENQSFEDP